MCVCVFFSMFILNFFLLLLVLMTFYVSLVYFFLVLVISFSLLNSYTCISISAPFATPIAYLYLFYNYVFFYFTLVLVLYCIAYSCHKNFIPFPPFFSSSKLRIFFYELVFIYTFIGVYILLPFLNKKIKEKHDVKKKNL